MHRLALVTLGIAALAACIVEEDGDLDTTNACDRYADYVCVCHASDDDTSLGQEDCDGLKDLARTAGDRELDGCATDLAELKATDEEEGLVCSV